MDLNDFWKTESKWNYVDGKEGAGGGQTAVQNIQRKQNKMKRTETMYTQDWFTLLYSRTQQHCKAIIHNKIFLKNGEDILSRSALEKPQSLN